MSCEQTLKAYEDCLERFWNLMEDYNFQKAIYMNFLSHQEQWEEREFGFSEDPYNNFFDHMWEWCAEDSYYDLEGTVNRYLEKLTAKGAGNG